MYSALKHPSCTLYCIENFQVEKRLKELEKASNTADLLNSFKNLGNDLMDLAKLSGKRQAVSASCVPFVINRCFAVNVILRELYSTFLTSRWHIKLILLPSVSNNNYQYTVYGRFANYYVRTVAVNVYINH